MPGKSSSFSLAFSGEEDENKGAIFTKERLLCCLIMEPVIEELKCTSYTYFKLAVLGFSDNIPH